MKTLDFEKDPDGRWFAVIPEWEGERADLEMVLGADMMLDIYAQGDGSISLSISDSEILEYDRLELVEICDSTTGGAYYKVREINGVSYDFRIWLCDVTTFVFGTFPQNLYIQNCTI